MATVQRYVNAASTAGGDGTTNATSGANRAYASLSEWRYSTSRTHHGQGGSMKRPYTLWSLWDVLTFNAGKLLVYVNGLSLLTGPIPDSKRLAIPPENLESIRENIAFICAELERLDLPLPLVSATEVSKILNGPYEEVRGAQYHGGRAFAFSSLDTGRLKNYSRDLLTRLKDTLSAKTIMVMPAGAAAMYEPTTPLFGKEVNDKFQSSGVFEIDEAAKCLALNRPTACVFHLMRVLEVAIAAARESLAIPDPVKPAERNWATILRKFKEEIDRRNKAIPKEWAQPSNAMFFEEVYVSLDAVRNVWRNATMHVESKYTPEEADHIFNAVRGLMKKIASRIDESGQPGA